MTLIQLKAVLLSAKLGSVSQAAQALGISQSNVSNYIKAVENEYGYQILKRGHGGVVTTPTGKEFIAHAQAILEENEKIAKLGNTSKRYKLRIGSMNYAKSLDLLIQIYNRLNQGPCEFDFQYHNVSLETGLEMLRDLKLDVLVAFLRASSIETCSWVCNNLNLEKIPFTKYPFNIRLRKGHPLIEKGVFEDGSFNFEILKDYPYVDYPSFNKETKLLDIDDNSYKFYSYLLMVDGKENRMRVVGQTDGYSFGAPVSEEDKERFGLECFDLPDFDGYLNLIIRKGETEKNEINQFISLFKESI